MPKNTFQLGSPNWAAHVFSTPPVRNLKGRSKATQFHQFWSHHQGRMIGVQGRNEAVAALLLEHLTARGHFTRFKEQPFQSNLEEFGHEIIPDFMAVSPTNRIYLIEVKSSRFITQRVDETLNRNRECFQGFEISYLVWTDKYPLNKFVRHNLLSMRRYAHLVHPDERTKFAEHIHNAGSENIGALYKAGFDYGVICASAWNREAHFPIFEELTHSTLVSAQPIEKIASIALGAGTQPCCWWDSLGRAC